MTVRQLSPTGDFTFGQSQLNLLSNTPATVAQVVQTSLLLWLGEWFLDLTAGTPWIQGVLGKHNQKTADVTVQDEILGVQGVTDIQTYTSIAQASQRKYLASARIDTIYGPTEVQVSNSTLFQGDQVDVSSLVYIDSTGYHYADYPTFLSYVQDQYRAIYGADIYLGADSMDGQWTAILAQSLYDTAALGAAAYNSFSPVTAQGVGLSRVVKINGISRNIPTNSEVILTIIGTAGTVITNGVAVDTLSQQWSLPASVTIPPGGSIDVTATAQVQGAIAAEANTVTGIFTPTLGWQTVNNAAAASPGAPVETDSELRTRQAQSTAIPAQTVIQATTSALANLPGVTGVRAYENVTDSTDGNGLTPHSVCFVVEGGDISAITNVIGLYKTPGTNTYASGTNAQHQTYLDPAGLPVPINFYNPAITATIAVQLTIKALTGWDTSFETPIAAAVAALIETFGIGGTVVYTQIFVAAYNASPIPGTYYVQGVQINKNGGSFSAANIILAFNEIPICDPSVNVGFTIV